MARIKEAVLSKNNVYAGTSPALNLLYGGQNGILPKIGQVGPDGKSYDEWISNHAYIKKNVIPVVLKYPKFFDLMPDTQKWIDTYVTLLELHPLTIDGLTSGLSVTFDEHPVGGSGEQQEELTNVERARSNPSFTFKEKAGKSIQKFLNMYIRYGMMDPDVKKPLVTSLSGFDISKVGGMYTPDYYTGTVLFIEPDTTHKVVVDAWLCSNMAPKTDGDRTGKRDIRSAGEVPEYTIDFTAITLNNDSVIGFAQTILDKLTKLSQFPDLVPSNFGSGEGIVLPSKEVDPNVTASNHTVDGRKI